MHKRLFIWTFTLLIVSYAHSQTYDLSFHSEFEQSAFQSRDPLRILFASDAAVDQAKYTAYSHEILSVLAKLAPSHGKMTDAQFLEKVFYTVHRKKLGWYQNYVSFSEIFESKRYDCLTGTALYSLILDHFQIEHKLYEFDYHVLLIAKTDEGSFLFEATDPINGFVTDQQEIARRIAVYAVGADPNRKLKPIGNALDYTHSSHINNQISFSDLAGLQYYNLAIEAFNAGAFSKANLLIRKACSLYPAERIRTMQFYFAQSTQLFSGN